MDRMIVQLRRKRRRLTFCRVNEDLQFVGNSERGRGACFGWLAGSFRDRPFLDNLFQFNHRKPHVDPATSNLSNLYRSKTYIITVKRGWSGWAAIRKLLSVTGVRFNLFIVIGACEHVVWGRDALNLMHGVPLRLPGHLILVSVLNEALLFLYSFRTPSLSLLKVGGRRTCRRRTHLTSSQAEARYVRAL